MYLYTYFTLQFKLLVKSDMPKATKEAVRIFMDDKEIRESVMRNTLTFPGAKQIDGAKLQKIRSKTGYLYRL